jgi:MFS family permease
VEHYSHKLRLHLTTLASSTMVAPALAAIGKDLSIQSETQLQLCLSIFVLGYSFGPLWWAPLSELYGRFVVVQATMTWFCVWNLVAGFAHTEALMIVSRLFFRDQWKCLSCDKCSFPKGKLKTESNGVVFSLAAASTDTSGLLRREDSLLQLQLCYLSSGLRSGLYSGNISLST